MVLPGCQQVNGNDFTKSPQGSSGSLTLGMPSGRALTSSEPGHLQAQCMFKSVILSPHRKAFEHSNNTGCI